MATTSATMTATESGLQDLAKRHLWMHFTRHGAYQDADVPIIVRGDGPYVWDERGNRTGGGARLLHSLELRPPARDRARDADRVARSRGSEPRLLHEQRIGGG